MASTYLVTGGCGFIGSNFILRLLAERPDARVVNLDKLTYAGNPDNLREVADDPRYTFVHGDICDAQVVTPLMAEADYVVHFAAETHVDRSLMEPGSFIQTDVFGTYTLLEAARQNPRLQRFLHISTDEVYGEVLPTDPPVARKRSLQPAQPVLREQSRRRDAVQGLRRDVRPAGRRRPAGEQRRPAPARREGVPLLHDERAPRPAAAHLRRRACRCATASTSRTTARRSTCSCTKGHARRGLQRRRGNQREPAGSRADPRPAGEAAQPDPLRRGPRRPRPRLLPRLDEDQAPGLGAAPRPQGHDGEDGRVVPREPLVVGEGARRSLPEGTTSSEYGRRLATRRALQRMVDQVGEQSPAKGVS